ncbi:MAG: tripartite tricarboxylate transporter substrate binding protein [Betaproteobacteria bacterium]|nr:MAG: tripartite tricarboxylate transporter substrate binding protein [Betaproteobacteria bacterium]
MAQDFPAKPVRVVVPFPPGGGADALARLLGPQLASRWGQQVIVENKPGASGHIGADFVAQSPADGYTLLMSSTASLTEKNVDRFAPVSLVSASAYIVGTGQALTDLLAGQVDLLFAPSQTVLPHVKAGRLKALAVTGAQRAQTLPGVPTVAESGLPGYEAVGWFGLLAPAATPGSIVLKLSADVNSVLAQAEVRAKMTALGADPGGNTPEEFARFIREDQAKWAKLMRQAGIEAAE